MSPRFTRFLARISWSHRWFAYGLLISCLVGASLVSAVEPNRTFPPQIVAVTTPYYLKGPQQASPPDGMLQAGKIVTIVRKAGSYAQVRSEQLTVFVATSALLPWSDEQQTRLTALVLGNNRFAVELYGQLRDNAPGNVFFSPYSVSTALAMTYGGARGETAQQMAEVLHYSLGSNQVAPANHDLVRLMSVGTEAGYQLTVANRLWGQTGYGFLPDFIRLTAQEYDSPLTELNFRQNLEAARGEINRWVEQETRGKITSLVPPGSLDAQTRLVLTNAIYFKGDWSEPFEAKRTAPVPFHVTAEETVKVPTMHRESEYGYAELDQLQLLELPYGNGDLSMVVLLPKSNDGLGSLEESLTAENLHEWLAKLSQQEVSVYLPRFKLTLEARLDDSLKSLGMKLPFTADANFSGMSSHEDLMIGAVLHKAFVEVNEKGTEAAAATAVIMLPTAAFEPQPPPEFKADHPFVFLIRDRRTQSILFLGRLTKPEK